MQAEGGQIQASLLWLAGQQSKNGSFIGGGSSEAMPFRDDRSHPNAFFTSLILIALHGIAGNKKITQKGIEFIKSQQSPIGSWNYWDRQSDIAQEYPFPDDLDDTACALMALSLYDQSYVDGSLLAKLAQLLIVNELKPGGPYRTWLVEPSLYKDWGDTDLAVNANIGGLLAHHGVTAPRLKEYVDHQLDTDKLGSRYYLGDVPSLYFLSRWYKDQKLKQSVVLAFKTIDSRSDMEVAMLLTAGRRLDISSKYLDRAYKQLVANCKHGHWAAAGLYIELTVDGTIYYAGSPALTTAFALEAINLYKTSSQEPSQVQAHRSVPDIYKQIMQSNASMPLKLKKPYLAAAKLIAGSDKQGQIIDMAGIAAAAFGVTIPKDTLGHLNQASLNGWVAYSIYDDFYDDEAETSSLSVANHALRQTVLHYQAALPDSKQFANLVHRTLDIIDTANQWEVLNARGKLEEGVLNYKLPSYGNYSKLAERSWGHVLAATGVSLAAGYEIKGDKVINLQKFFHHYLIARQLNDDAHDWLEDLQKGHLSSVVTLLLKSYKPGGKIDIKKEQKQLQIHFWQTTINEVALLINKHLKNANKSLKACNLTDDKIFISWLSALEEATRQAVDGSQQAQKFINSYSGE